MRLQKRAGIFLALASCHGACGNSSPANDSGVDAAVVFADASALAPQRCTNVAHVAQLGSPPTVGDAVATDDGFVIGMIRENSVFSVAMVSADLSKITYADIGPMRADASPPQPFLWGKSVYIAWINAGELRIGRVENGKVALIAQAVTDFSTYIAKDPVIHDIPSFDVMTAPDRGVVVWDFLDPRGSNVRSASFSKNGIEARDGGLEQADISPAATDADTPRLAPRKGGGYWVIWIAHKAEATSDASALEVPGETPTYRWLEAAPLDERGDRVGDPVRLTPTSGHVAGFDLLVAADRVDVIARDATESEDEGTSISRITLTDKAGDLEVLAGEIGRAVPDVVTAQTQMGAVAWAVVPDMNDATRIVPIAPPGSKSEPASIEPLLRSSRALALRAVPESPNAGVEILVVGPSGGSSGGASSGSAATDRAEIRLISCSR